MVDEHSPDEGVDRRWFLHRAALAAGAGVAVPLTGGVASARPVDGDPDRLFQDGRFAEAEAGYRHRLRGNPDDAHAAARIGYLALLANRFGDAERYLARAVRLDPADEFSLYQLADSFVRRDRLGEAAFWLRKTQNQTNHAMATLYERVQGRPWRVHGPHSTAVPLLGLDPLPHMRVSINGRPPKIFLLDTGATSAGFSVQVADEAGLEEISSSQGSADGQKFTMYHGIADSVRIGDIEVRNAPVHWNKAVRPALPDGTRPDGVIGTTHFYHFLTTVDYGHRRFVLRRKTRANLRAVRDQTKRAGGDVLPLWLAKDHFPLTLGSINGYGSRVATFDTGGPGRGLGMSVETAKRAGIPLGEPVELGNGRWGYVVAPETSGIGRAVRRRVKAWVEENPRVDDGMLFDTIANFTHEFFTPYAITLDFTGMNLFITGDSMRPDG
ncbi:hypothetical protein E1287_14825 [Actinomadura sp. KC06]|uniref:aspartyl protease family protein n=1 Tax=Actinomadura sp. KC06 TaxID=2530369 RepID=UPI00105103D3|nr:aspartyl protease family protein [Actinomadura sp. KC06]TDD35048.1 hypothetical protein E1287_14825 [Actinomadura sp. KC06]